MVIRLVLGRVGLGVEPRGVAESVAGFVRLRGFGCDGDVESEGFELGDESALVGV